MNLIKPKKLKKGDTIGLLSVSGYMREPQNIERAKNYFNSKGYNTVISDTTYKEYRFYSGSDDERLKAFHDFFLNDEIDAIVCTRGGYGTLRIAQKLDYDIIRKHPKIFCGYSDITILLMMMYKNAGLIGFHGAMASGDFGIDNISKFTETSFFDTLCGNKNFEADSWGNILRGGKAEGILWGGNLATISSMVGLDFVPDEKFVMFLEDVNEPGYKIDRMLTQVFNEKKIQKNITGLVIGHFTDEDNNKNVEDVIREYAEQYNLPCVNRFNISHEYDKYTLPYGLKCEFSADDRKLTVKEYAFSD